MKLMMTLLTAALLLNGCATETTDPAPADVTQTEDTAAADTPGDTSDTAEPDTSVVDTAEPEEDDGCWLPEQGPAGGPDCIALCDQFETVCGADAGDNCAGGCATATAMFEVEHAQAIQTCIEEAECGYEKAEQPWVACMVGLPQDLLTPPAEHATLCEDLTARLAACEDDRLESMTTLCVPMVATLIQAGLEQLAACADAPCEELGQCIDNSNCFLPLFLAGLPAE